MERILTTWDPPQTVLVTTPERREFAVYVASNLSTTASAHRAAVARAGSYCIRTHGTNVIRFTKVRRHSNLELSSWVFQGLCR